MTVTAKVLRGYGGKDDLRIFRNGQTTDIISIDRTYYGREWCEKHGMVITETVEADSGEMFEIWRLERRMVCAIPVKKGGS